VEVTKELREGGPRVGNQSGQLAKKSSINTAPIIAVAC
jgi:hypothetical protein